MESLQAELIKEQKELDHIFRLIESGAGNPWMVGWSKKAISITIASITAKKNSVHKKSFGAVKSYAQICLQTLAE